ncbi:MAG: phosphoribosyl-AMP cyclohydrolase [Aestuariivirga sp.]
MSSGAEESLEFAPVFDKDGLIPAIVCDAANDRVLMFAHMNREALKLTQSSGVVHLWSRSRKALWKKGEQSGETLAVREILVDCDQDVLLVKAEPQGKGAACHTGRKSCFYRKLEGKRLSIVDDVRLFNPAETYRR